MPRSRLPELVVFSDLDGTLLDHETYGFEAARPALEALRARRIPLVLASSKTAAEIAPLRARLGFSGCPAIVENGAGVLPGGAMPSGGGEVYARLRHALETVPARLRAGFSGFGDWDAAEVARRTGPDPDTAALARLRQFSEPGLWTGPGADLPAFEAALRERGLAARRGGRFLTLSFGGTKADRMAEIRRACAGTGDALPMTLALGDAPNDIEMIEAADFGVIVANPAHEPLAELQGEALGRIRRTRAIGPAGWNEAVLAILTEAAPAP